MSFTDMMNTARADREAGKTPGSFTPPPFGRYVAVLKDGAIAKSKAGNKQCWLEWVFLEGEEKGRIDRQFHRLEGGKRLDVSLSYFEKELSLMEVDTKACTSDEDYSDAINALVRRHPMVTYVVKRGKGLDKEGQPYINKNVSEFLGDFEGDLPEDIEARAGVEGASEAAGDNNAVPEAPQIDVAVGVKFKYSAPDGKVYTGTIKNLNINDESVDFPFHSKIKLDKLVEPVAG